MVDENSNIYKSIMMGFQNLIWFGEQIPDVNYVIRLEELKAFYKKSQLKPDVLDYNIKKNAQLIIQINPPLLKYWQFLGIIIRRENSFSLNQRHGQNEYISSSGMIQRMAIKIFESDDNDDVKFMALLNCFKDQVERVEYPLFKDIVTYRKETSEIDLESIFSVEEKIKKWDKFVTFARAIRDADSHTAYDIREGKIKISNHKKGYNFDREYTYIEFETLLKSTMTLDNLIIQLNHLFLVGLCLHNEIEGGHVRFNFNRGKQN